MVDPKRLKYMNRQDRIAAIQAEYRRTYPGRTDLRLSFENFCYVVDGSMGKLSIDEELVCDLNPSQFVEFLRGVHPS